MAPPALAPPPDHRPGLACWRCGRWPGGCAPLLKWQGEKIASAELGRPVHIGAVVVRPWSLQLALHDLRIDAAPGAPPLLSVARLWADAELQSVFRLAPVIDALRIESPALHLTHLGEGRYDIDDLLARLAARPAAPEPAALPRFALYNIELTDGRIDFDDRAAGRQHQVRQLRLALPFLSSLPAARQIKVEPQLAFVVNGSAFDSRAQALPFDASRQTEASLQLKSFDLQPYRLPAGGAAAAAAGGHVDANLRAAFAQAGAPTLSVRAT